MNRLRTMVMAGAVTALAATAVGAPVSASNGKGTIGVVNGIPGQRVDICINGKEIRSRTPYGGRAFRTLAPGNKVIKIFKADSRKCKGVKLGKKVVALADGADWTIVVNRKAPRFVMFDNTGLGMIPPDGPILPNTMIAWRHAADLGNVDFYFAQQTPDSPIAPALHPNWQEGDNLSGPGSPSGAFRVSATRPHKAKRIARSKFVDLKAGYRYEWYLLGTTAKNAKFIVWSRAVSLPTP